MVGWGAYFLENTHPVSGCKAPCALKTHGDPSPTRNPSRSRPRSGCAPHRGVRLFAACRVRSETALEHVSSRMAAHSVAG